MELHLHEWGDPAAPPVVCLHGVTAHGRRFRKLAEERLAERFHILAPDLRGHGFSDWEPPWTMATYAHDVLETLDAAGVKKAAFVGHSFGGRLVLELAALDRDRVERAALLDPAIQVLPHVGYDFAERERVGQIFTSPEEAIDIKVAEKQGPRAFVAEDIREHLVQSDDGTFRFRYCQSAVITLYSELCTPPPPPETLRVSTLLLYASAFGLVRSSQLAAYTTTLGDLLEVVAVTGGHNVYWDAYDETAGAIERFLTA